MGLFGPTANQLAFQNIAARLGVTIPDKAMSFEIQRSGCTYKADFSQHKSTVTLNIRALTENLPDVAMRTESATDRFGKRIGLNYELQTGDPLFDKHVFVVCGRETDALMRLLEPDGVRKGVLFVLQSGFNKVTFGKNGFSTQKVSSGSLDVSPDRFEEVLAALELIQQGLPDFSQTDLRYHSLKPFTLVGVSLALSLLAGIILLVLGNTQFRPLDNAIYFSGVGVGVMVWLVTLFLAGRFLRGKPDAFNAWLTGCILGLGVGPLFCVGLTLVLNGALDKSTQVPHTAFIQNMQTVRNKKSLTYYMYLKSWRPSEPTVTVKVPAWFYQTHSVGQKATITTKAGHFGWEWVVSP